VLLLSHQNPAIEGDGAFRVDRKFDVGMRFYCDKLSEKIVAVLPRARYGQAIMDPVDVSQADAPYRVVVLDVDDSGRPTNAALGQLRELVACARLVYGQSLGAAQEAAKLRVPYISVVEYTVGTQVTVSMCDVSGPLRKLVRGFRAFANYHTMQLPELRGAVSVHCNGYPIYDALKTRHPHCLLYLDSRVTRDMVIEAGELQRRLAGRRARKLRLIYTGRFVRMKGAAEVVATALALKGLGVDFELDLYGQGEQRPAMEAMISSNSAGEFIRIHDPIPFGQLFELSKSFDLFICCHVQSDPSCTYLEAHGAGLPIAGYDNQMWRRLNGEAGSGVVEGVGDAGALARRIATFIESDEYEAAAIAARAFALAHSFEGQFDRRVEDIRKQLDSARRSPQDSP